MVEVIRRILIGLWWCATVFLILSMAILAVAAPIALADKLGYLDFLWLYIIHFIFLLWVIGGEEL